MNSDLEKLRRFAMQLLPAGYAGRSVSKGVTLLSLPEEYELISFFEVEPELLDNDETPWLYNELKFVTTRGEDEVVVKIYAAIGEFSVDWKQSGRSIIKMKLTELDSLTIEMLKNDEFLSVSGMFSDHSVFLKLRLKPEVAIEFDHESIR